MNKLHRFFSIIVLLISSECYASKVHYWKGEAEGEISTEAYFPSDTHGDDVVFVLYCDKVTGAEYKASLAIRVDYEKHPADQPIKSDAISFLQYKMNRSYDKLLKNKAETMPLCLNAKCSPYKWHYGELDNDLNTEFSFKKSNEIRSIGISSDITQNAISAKVNLNQVMNKLCALKSSKRKDYSD